MAVYTPVILVKDGSVAAAAASAWVKWPGGSGLLEVVGTFAASATLTLQKKGADGSSTALSFGSSATFTANGMRNINLPECYLRVIGAVDTISALTVVLTPLRTDMAGAPVSAGSDLGATVTTVPTTTGAGTSTGAARVIEATDSLLVQPGLTASATFTPAANSHTANDCNGAAGTFALGAISASRVMILSAELLINSATAEATAWRLYLYDVTPPSAIADDGAFDLGTGDQASFLGYVDLGTAVDLGTTQWVETHFVNKPVKLAGTGVFGYLVNLTTLTPAAVAHTVRLKAGQL
jgi:hypothetical protein